MDDVWKGFTLLVGALVAWIGLQLWWINREKLRLDLFTRRHAVFDAVRKFIASIVRDAKVDPAAQRDFWTGTADAGFLFHSEVTTYIDLIHTRAANLHAQIQMQKSPGANHAHHVEAESDLFNWFSEQLRDDGLPKVFAR